MKKRIFEMKFTSTRSLQCLTSAEAISRGIASDGGLFVPENFPAITPETAKELCTASYKERAEKILAGYLTDFTSEEIRKCVEGAYTGTFENEDPAPLKKVTDKMYLLELWHGPTCAFKDMALQLLPYLLTVSISKTSPGKTIIILVATSGDTGKAALEGFADVENTRIIVFFPQNGVSDMQKLQMTTQTGKNVAVCGIEGNFDDAQSGVKAIFGDEEMRKFLKEKNMDFSSANSINFGRLVPQIVYYVSAWCDLVKQGKLKEGESFNVCVPTGNFGNILAAWYAKQMGIPIARFICASNTNKILTDFIRTGVYDRNREFYTTTSPSMDILISSNLERLLYHLYDNDAEKIASLMDDLKKKGKFTVSNEVLARLQQDFYGGFATDDEAKASIGKHFKEEKYLCDTHTAVAVNVYEKYAAETGDDRITVIASTASPFKFAPAVLSAIDDGKIPEDGFEVADKLSAVSGMAVPAPLATLKTKEVLHKNSIAKEEMADFIRKSLA